MKIETEFIPLKKHKKYNVITWALIIIAFVCTVFFAFISDALDGALRLFIAISPLILVLLFKAIIPLLNDAIAKNICSLTSLELTDDNLTGTYGKIFKKSLNIPIEQIDNIIISEEIIDKINGAKSLIVTSANGRAKFHFVKNAEEFSKVTMDVLKKFKKNYGNTSVKVDTTKEENESVSQGDKTDEIRNYKKLLDEGIISQEEFDAKKKQLLGL